ncbi:hypothetical protein BGZ83_009225 [Gryganskiella cystojenkinii]|nr:hypothetical protein BGZ83_009225 [Gryganskiella cystojenkinii]
MVTTWNKIVTTLEKVSLAVMSPHATNTTYRANTNNVPRSKNDVDALKFHQQCVLKYGVERTELIAVRLLQMVNMDPKVADAFSALRDADKGPMWGWMTTQQHMGMPMPDTDSLEFLLESIPSVSCPHECDEWRPVVEAVRRSRNVKESEDTRKQQQQQKMTVTLRNIVANNNGARGEHDSSPAAAAATTALHSHQYSARGGGFRGRGYRGGYNNSFRGGQCGSP